MAMSHPPKLTSRVEVRQADAGVREARRLVQEAGERSQWELQEPYVPRIPHSLVSIASMMPQRLYGWATRASELGKPLASPRGAGLVRL